MGDVTSNLVQEQIALAVAGLPNGTRDQIARVITNVVASAAGGAAGGVSGAAGASSADMFNRQLHPWEYEYADKNAKVVAAHLKITEEEAKGRIVAEILRNSDKDSAESAGARHDWEIRAAVGCSNLNCSGFKTDPEYANSQFNMQFVGTYFDSYAGGMGFLQSGLTDLELRQKNLTYERLGKGSMALTACVLSGGTACGALGLVSMFVAWVVLGGQKKAGKWEKFAFWLKSTLFTTAVLLVWLMYRLPELGVGYAILIAICCGAFLNLCKSHIGLLIP